VVGDSSSGRKMCYPNCMVHRSWSKGFTKENHPSIRKISETMKRRKVDNFSNWRQEAVRTGRIRTHFPALPQNGDLAEVIGVILGDGHIEKFPRTERLLIFSNSNNRGFVKRYSDLVEKLFRKRPYVYKQSGQNCVRISIYENRISERLGIPTGSRKNIPITVPGWVARKKPYIIRYLRGLYEAEGSYSIHKPTYTYKFVFSNKNQFLLKNVSELLKVLGFSPHSDTLRVQLSRRNEVLGAVKLLRFRRY